MIDVLLPYQQAWAEDESQQKISEKSRRVGLSYTEALCSVMAAAPSKNWQNTYYLSYNKDMTRQFVKDCAYWATVIESTCSDIMEDAILDDDGNPVGIFRIRFASGAVIEGLPSEAYALRSKKGRVVVDEAAFCKNFEQVLKAAQALLIWGGQLVVISTHNGEDNPFNLLIQDVKKGIHTEWSLHRTTFDEAIEQGLYKRICLVNEEVWSKDKEENFIEKIRRIYKDNALEELDCVPASGNGKYFSRGVLNACVSEDVSVIRWNFSVDFLFEGAAKKKRTVEKMFESDIAPLLRGCEGKVFIGEDFARSGDLTVYWIAEQTGTYCRTVAILEVKNCPFEEQENTARMMMNTCYQVGNLGGMAIDGRGNGQQIAETMSLEFPGVAVGVMETASWYGIWFAKLKAMFETEDFSLPDDETILCDFGIITLKNGNPYVPDVRLKDRDGGKRHGDGALACVLCYYAVNECVASPAPIFETVKEKKKKRWF